MYLVFHGGECCGIRHIHHISHNPYDTLYARDVGVAANSSELMYPSGYRLAHFSSTSDGGGVPCNDKYGKQVASRMDFFRGSLPTETALNRLKRYIAFCEERRKKGVIEITTAAQQTANWSETLRGLEFKPVNEFVNSNSNNTVTIWHRNSEDAKTVTVESPQETQETVEDPEDDEEGED